MTTRIGPLALSRRVALGALLLIGASAQAQSLRCSDNGVREGDSKLSLLRACGQPTLSDAYCVPIYTPGDPGRNGQVQPVYSGCVMTDEWLYDRGPGNLAAVVKIREGRIISIRFGEQGR
ncbi:DUF2845 domain-containing protein [Roseateles amylovorans]|uniref:DUF2845 domain-containing protein n=1 Tax=Roseateles amylovorans TaxID=2978473 RepID=A0ABY6B3T8_9BURK|nr:DUF2845 domain-containing protein [Roseateles amylovorans]UXH79390.1 DUF2845 domain-containing protein [Roseateles amylovorans]